MHFQGNIKFYHEMKQSHGIKLKLISAFQAGEFFHSAQSSALEQQREYESRPTGEETLETPLLLEQVQASTFLFLTFIFFLVLTSIFHSKIIISIWLS